MTCSSCVHSIESNVKKRAGVLDVSVALTTERGKVKFDPTLIGERNIIGACAGYMITSQFCMYGTPQGVEGHRKNSSILDIQTNTQANQQTKVSQNFHKVTYKTH